MPRERKNNQQLTYARFPLRDRGPPTVQNNQLTAAEKNFYETLCIDEDIVNTIENETRDQSLSERWKLERKYRFTASQFYLISHRKHISCISHSDLITILRGKSNRFEAQRKSVSKSQTTH